MILNQYSIITYVYSVHITMYFFRLDLANKFPVLSLFKILLYTYLSSTDPLHLRVVPAGWVAEETHSQAEP